MRISEETLENFSISYPLDRLAPLERILFIDIETTGFTARFPPAFIWLVVPIIWLENGIRFSGCQKATSRRLMLSSIFEFAKSYRYLIHFNGNNFDLPFILQKCEQYKLPYSFEDYSGVDLYKRIAPYKYFFKAAQLQAENAGTVPWHRQKRRFLRRRVNRYLSRLCKKSFRVFRKCPVPSQCGWH